MRRIGTDYLLLATRLPVVLTAVYGFFVRTGNVRAGDGPRDKDDHDSDFRPPTGVY